ncbi:hypothetical protein [Antrihabitans cavernicola]|uniref:Uncharacterized protein n=1 Tax=Antrihabitans cavernicola TaxID=2495913 RepID=A0A5A7S5L6_9NOCA|nr:hypothetical protein [Spelaeibacter cavernicola]KAA0019501.1 hypothetical protein FOY51_22945 [Spelaeibacter cavernicola]
MTRLRRIGPWLPLAVLGIQAVFVWSGVLDLRDAVIIAVVLEVLLWSVLLVRSVTAIRAYRSRRASGSDGWQAAEHALAQVMPTRAARWVLLEPRMWVCLASWIFGTQPTDDATRFSYNAGRKILISTLIAITAVDTVVIHVVLWAIFGNHAWVWVVTGLDVYAMLWFLGFYASMVTLPHLLDDKRLVLRYGVFDELVVPRAAITGARTATRDPTSRRLRTEDDGSADFSCGTATIALALDTEVCLYRRGDEFPAGISTLFVTVDQPGEFISTLRADSRRTGQIAPAAREFARGS